MRRSGWRPSTFLRGLTALLCVLVLSAPAAAQGSVSQEQELAIGKMVAGELISKFGIVADPAWLAYLAQIRDRLLPFSGRSNIPYELIILDTPILNAASTPGYIFVTRGMLGAGLTTEGWVFVLGHEMGHTIKRHVAAYIELANNATLLSILVGIFTRSRAAVDLVQLVLELSTLGFSRDKETEADLESLRMMVEAGFDPTGAAQTLAWFNEATGHSQERTNWAGSHPGFLDRIAAVNAAYAAFPSRGLPLRVWYFQDRQESAEVVVRPAKLLEMSDAWVLTLAVENSTNAAATIFEAQAALASPDGDLTVRFLRSTLSVEIAAEGKIEGRLVFEKRSRAPPAALTLPVLFPDRRLDIEIPLTNGGPYRPQSSSSPLPKPPTLP